MIAFICKEGVCTLRLRYTDLMIFMTKFPNFIFKESKQV